jgi:hypothetical protein
MKTNTALIVALLVSYASVQAQHNQRQKDRRATSQREQADTASEKASQGQYANPPASQNRSKPKDPTSYRQQDQNKPSATESFEEKNKPQNPDQYVIDRTTQSDRTDYNLVSMEGMTLISAADYPASLRKTLRNPRYKGWETGKLYRDESTGEYLLIMGKNGNDDQPLNYRFDKDGKAIDEKNPKSKD